MRAIGVPDRARVVAAVSGGPDSTALLSILCSRSGPVGYEVHACIVDHGIRKPEETAEDVAFVRRLADGLGVPLHVRQIQPGECAAASAREKRSLEEVAREKRLRLLAELARELDAGYIVLGHTLDDHVETILMRMIQGAGPQGLSGIPVRRGIFIRPLMSVRRWEILEYLAAHGLSYRTDSTNADPRFLRNRVRSTLVPALESIQPEFRGGLAATAARAKMDAAFLAEEANRRLSWRRRDQGFSINLKDFFGAPPALRAQSLLSAYDVLWRQGYPQRLPFGFLAPVLGARPPAGQLPQGHGVRMRRVGDILFWERDIVTFREKGYFIAAEADGSYAISRAVVCVDIMSGSHDISGTGEVRISQRGIVRPLVLRSKRKGDAINLSCGRKSIKDLFQEWKVSGEEGSKVPLLVDRQGVVAVLGGAVGRPSRVRAGAEGTEGGSLIVRARRCEQETA